MQDINISKLVKTFRSNWSENQQIENEIISRVERVLRYALSHGQAFPLSTEISTCKEMLTAPDFISRKAKKWKSYNHSNPKIQYTGVTDDGLSVTATVFNGPQSECIRVMLPRHILDENEEGVITFLDLKESELQNAIDFNIKKCLEDAAENLEATRLKTVTDFMNKNNISKHELKSLLNGLD